MFDDRLVTRADCAVRRTGTPLSAARRTDTARLTLDVFDEAREVEFDVRVGPAQLTDLLGPARALSATLTTAAVERAAARGREVACRQGCAACCRQLVPIAVVEAEALVRRLEKLPRSRSEQIRRRFGQAVAQLEALGMLDPDGRPGTRSLQVRIAEGQSAWDAVSRAYFEAFIDCPFLEDEACCVYDDRPLACREYVVTSDPSLCQVLDPAIEGVERPVRMGEVLADLSARLDDARPASFPLVLLLEWVAATPRRERRSHDGEALFHALVRALDERDEAARDEPGRT